MLSTSESAFESDTEWQEFAYAWMSAWNDRVPKPKEQNSSRKRPEKPKSRSIPVIPANQESTKVTNVTEVAKLTEVKTKKLAAEKRQLAPVSSDSNERRDAERKTQIEGNGSPPPRSAAAAAAAAKKSSADYSWIDKLFLPHGPPDFRQYQQHNQQQEAKSSQERERERERNVARAAAAAGLLTWVGRRCMSHALPGIERPSYLELGAHLANVVVIESQVSADVNAAAAAAAAGVGAGAGFGGDRHQVQLVAPPDLPIRVVEQIRRSEVNLDQQRRFESNPDRYLRAMELATPSMAQEPRNQASDPITWKTCPSCYETLQNRPARACQRCHGLVCEVCILRWWSNSRFCMLCRYDPVAKREENPNREEVEAKVQPEPLEQQRNPPAAQPDEEDIALRELQEIWDREELHRKRLEKLISGPSRLFKAMARPFRQMLK